MNAAIITIGDELLIGQIVDTNSVFIAQELEKTGCKIYEKRAIADTCQAVTETLSSLQNKVDLVICTGGLGPTQDDKTKQAIIYYFNDQLVRNNEVLTHVTQLIESIYQRPITEINKQQADVPSKAKILFNKYGTAPGLLLTKEKTTFIFLPGVPFEMKHLVNEHIIPYISNHFSTQAIFHHTITTIGIGESLLAEKIYQWENNLKENNISLAYLPFLGGVDLRLSAYGENQREIESVVNHFVAQFENFIPKENILSLQNKCTLIETVSELLAKNDHKIAIAESFTGGNLTFQFSKIPGASRYLQGGMITYATQSKIDLLNVDKQTISQHSVVSNQVAIEMVKGVAEKYKANIALSTTGNAGPSKGDSDVEVGTVCIGLYYNGKTFGQTFQLGQPREKVIELAIHHALLMLYNQLIDSNN